MAITIMLSYSRKDDAVVKALAQGLDAAKRDVWFDHDLAGGDAWWDSILESIRTADVFLFALSEASLHSKPCRLELDYALDLGRPVVPVQVGPVASLRANPVAELQIIPYSPDNAQTGFTVLSAVDEAARRVRPLPDPLPPPPPIPFAYLVAIGRQIDRTQLTMNEQVAAVEQLRRALGEETDESVRRDILAMLENLNSKPWTTKWAEREIAALLYAHSPRRTPGAPTAGRTGAEPPEPSEPSKPSEPSRPSEQEPDTRVWLAQRLERLLEQRSTEESGSGPDPGYWRPPPDAAAQWRRTFERTDQDALSASEPSPPGSRPPWSGPQSSVSQSPGPASQGPGSSGSGSSGSGSSASGSSGLGSPGSPWSGPQSSGPPRSGPGSSGSGSSGSGSAGSGSAGSGSRGQQSPDPAWPGSPSTPGAQGAPGPASPWAATASSPGSRPASGRGSWPGPAAPSRSEPASGAPPAWSGVPSSPGTQTTSTHTPPSGAPSATSTAPPTPGASRPNGFAWQATQSTPPTAAPPNRRAMSVIAVLGLFGIVALYFSAQVGRRYRAGDVDGSIRASNAAKAWAIAGIICCALWLSLSLLGSA